MTSINYLMPLSIKHKDIEHICFIDYTRDNVYFSDKNLGENLKNELTEIILKKVNSDNLIDVKSYDINSNLNLTKIINDIKNDTIRKKYDQPFKEDETNE